MNYQALNSLAALAMGWTEDWHGVQGYHGHEPPIGIMWYSRGDNALVPKTWPYYKFKNQTTDSLCRAVPADPMFGKQWNPAECADDALMFLNKITGGEWWQLAKSDAGEGYTCDSGAIKASYSRYAETASLAMTLCALRAAGTPEDQIAKAMED